MKNPIFVGIMVVFVITISLSLLSEQAIAQTTMSPRQQMMMGTNPDQIVCAEDKVLMMRGIGNNPVCVNPNSYLRLADRGWGNFDMNMMENNQQMQNVMNSMIKNPNVGKLWYDIVRDNPQDTQSMVDQMVSSMRQNPQKMQPMMNFMMNDPELRQQMIDNMMNN
ncbi:MAG: hypothetical protein ACE5RC_07945, partial [Nitrosopumilus sp.]